MRTNSFPSMTVNHQNGEIYIEWTNRGVPGINTGDPDIYMIKSTDGGNTWGSPVRVNQDIQNNGKDQWFPWIAIDPVTRTLVCTFYDSRNFADNDSAETFVAVSYDSGSTWQDFKVSDSTWAGDGITGFCCNYAGDYIGIDINFGRVYPVWSDDRSGNMLTYTSPFKLIVTDLVLINEILTSGETVTYEATNSITAGPSFTVETNGDVTFAAGSKITLSPGFHAKEGSKFHAYIDEGLGGSAPSLPTAIATVAEVEAEVEEVQSQEDLIPTEYALSPAYPNPFNPYATIKYALKDDVRATLKVYDLLGREVRVLVNEHQPAAYHSVVWDGRDRSGRPLPSGVYIARLHATPTAGVAGDFVAGIKMVLLK